MNYTENRLKEAILRVAEVLDKKDSYELLLKTNVESYTKIFDMLLNRMDIENIDDHKKFNDIEEDITIIKESSKILSKVGKLNFLKDDIKYMKTLVYLNKFVDSNLLNKGIYFTTKPTIYSHDETIDNIISKYEAVSEHFLGLNGTNEIFIDNIKQCELKNIKIEILK